MTAKRLFAASVIGASLVVGSASLTIAQPAAPAGVVARFIGTWKEDESKRKIGSMGQLLFRLGAQERLEEVRGPEARPIVQPVVFDGKPHKIEGGNTIVWKQVDPNTFERVLSNAGGTLTTRRLRISTDGKTLTETTERKNIDGRTFVGTTDYRRTSGDGQGLAGRWTAVSFKADIPLVVKYEAVGTNGLKFSDEVGMSYTVTLDGKPAPVEGPAVITGTAIAAKPVDEHTIEFTQSREGVETGKSVRTVSADGKTLAITNTAVGPNAGKEPSVAVFIKQ